MVEILENELETVGIDFSVPLYGDERERAVKEFYRDKLKRVIDAEKAQWDLTMPRHNYLGPGTRVVTNLIENYMPRDVADERALEHDFLYLMAEDVSDIVRADNEFYRVGDGFETIASAGLLKAKSLLPGVDKSFLTDLNLTNDEIQYIADLATLRRRGKPI